MLIRKYLYGDGKTLNELPLDDGSYVLDAHWGYYFATGSPEPIKRIVGTLAWTKDKNSVEKLTIGSMSKWTLATNASRDKELLDILPAEMNTQPAEVRAPLREVIEAAGTFETERSGRTPSPPSTSSKRRAQENSRKFAWWGMAGLTAGVGLCRGRSYGSGGVRHSLRGGWRAFECGAQVHRTRAITETGCP